MDLATNPRKPKESLVVLEVVVVWDEEWETVVVQDSDA